MIDFDVEKKLGNSLRFQKEMPKSLEAMIINMARDILRISQENLVKNDSYVTGKLSQSGLYEFDPEDFTATVIYRAPYAAAVEFGTEPHFPPLGPSLKHKKLRSGRLVLDSTPSNITNPMDFYAVRKFGAREIGHCKWGKKYYGVHTIMGFGIWKAIGLKGTDPHPYFRPAIEEVEANRARYAEKHQVKL